MRIQLTSIFVDEQEQALRFYTDILGFRKKEDIDLGGPRWITVVSPEAPDGPELVLEPSSHPAVGPFRSALVADGIPFNSFTVQDCQAEYDRLVEAGVTFTQPPVDMGPVTMAVFDDTCGNLMAIASPNA
ncbi:MAG TPA: VOC family protein [Candidatus Limnocylindrales bacterium]